MIGATPRTLSHDLKLIQSHTFTQAVAVSFQIPMLNICENFPTLLDATV